MKKSRELSRKTWKMIAKNLIILAVLVAVALVGVMSWFTKGQRSKASGVNIECSLPPGLEIAVVKPGERPENSDWKTGTITINSGNYDFIENLKMSEITGDGITFTIPYLSQSDMVAYPDISSKDKWQEGTANLEYLSFDLYMRSKGDISVALGETSKIYPNTANEDLVSSDTFSVDNVVGAVRFAVLDNTYASRKLLWIPAPNIYYNGTDVTVNNSNTANQNGVTYNGTTYNDGTYNHAYYTSDGDRVVLKYGQEVTANNACDYTLGAAKNIAKLEYDNSAKYYINHVRCNMWIEGEDAEARSAFVGGEFKMSLDFDMVNN